MSKYRLILKKSFIEPVHLRCEVCLNPLTVNPQDLGMVSSTPPEDSSASKSPPGHPTTVPDLPPSIKEQVKQDPVELELMEKGEDVKEMPRVEVSDLKFHLTARQILDLALWVERTGVEFYRFLSEEVEDAGLRGFFLRLMGMEMEHEKLFLDMITSLPPTQSSKQAFDEQFTDREYFLLLRSVLKTKVFPDDFDLISRLDSFKKPRDALPMALDIEENSIVLYEFINKLKLSEDAKKEIERLISEENGHLREIKDILKKFGG